MKYIILVIASIFSIQVMAQPPLSKKHQKEKEAFEAMIAAEKKYESLIEKADEAFKNKDYVLARMTYEEAIPFNQEKEQWLISKVNDLDILMAKNAARKVDSIALVLPAKDAGTIGSDPLITADPLQRELPKDRPKVTSAELEDPDSTAEMTSAVEPKKETQKEENTIQNQVVEKDIKLKPKQASSTSPKETKVKEDFSAYDNGITEETFNLDNHTVLRIVVKEGIDVIVFKRVKHKWGGEFYFLDDVGTTQRYWNEQVEKYRLKFGTEEP